MIRRFEVRLAAWWVAFGTKQGEKQWKQVKEIGEVKKCVVIVILVDINLSFRFPRLTTNFRSFLEGALGAPLRMLAHITRPDRHENAKAERKNVYDNLTNPSIICSFAYFGGWKWTLKRISGLRKMFSFVFALAMTKLGGRGWQKKENCKYIFVIFSLCFCFEDWDVMRWRVMELYLNFNNRRGLREWTLAAVYKATLLLRP